MISSSLKIPNEYISKEFSVNILEEPSNTIPADKCGYYDINDSEQSIKIVQNSNSASISYSFQF